MVLRDLKSKLVYFRCFASFFKNKPYLAPEDPVVYRVTSFECNLIFPCLQDIFKQISSVFLLKLAKSVELLPKQKRLPQLSGVKTFNLSVDHRWYFL